MNYEVQQMTLKEKFDLGVQDPEFSQVMYKVVRVSSGRVVDFLIFNKNVAQEVAETFQAEEDYEID
jgi:hypothetical protein